MTRTVMAVGAVVGILSVGAARADWGTMPTASGMPVSEALGPGYGPPSGYAPPPGYGAPPMAGPHPTLLSYAGSSTSRAPDRYGTLPILKKMMWWKKDKCGDDCNGGNGSSHKNGAMYNGGPNGVNYGPSTQQGTLVFPNHPFVRSPRDFFMAGN